MSPRDYVILLVEDDPNDVILIQRAFTKAKVVNPLQVVNDGEAAIKYLSGEDPFADRDQHPLPVLILLDLKLPRKSGFEVLEWGETAKTPVAHPCSRAHVLEPGRRRQSRLRPGRQFLSGQACGIR